MEASTMEHNTPAPRPLHTAPLFPAMHAHTRTHTHAHTHLEIMYIYVDWEFFVIKNPKKYP